jgi:metal-sulfur cluster biosynthetic enzyme
MELLESKLWESLKEVMDPGANLNVVDMGLIRELSISDNGQVNIVLRPSSPVCPMAFTLAANIKEAIEGLNEVKSVHLTIVDFIRADELNKMMEDA